MALASTTAARSAPSACRGVGGELVNMIASAGPDSTRGRSPRVDDDAVDAALVVNVTLLADLRDLGRWRRSRCSLGRATGAGR
jgi:hypothetical protein